MPPSQQAGATNVSPQYKTKYTNHLMTGVSRMGTFGDTPIGGAHDDHPYRQQQQRKQIAPDNHLLTSEDKDPEPQARLRHQGNQQPSKHVSIDRDDTDEEEEELSEALLAVASAEDYAAKIIKLQQACLTPLKEDLADWLNKIMNVTSITSENFMDKLENGVIICRLAKVISNWCQQQIFPETSRQEKSGQHQQLQSNLIPQQAQANTVANSHHKQSFFSHQVASSFAANPFDSQLHQPDKISFSTLDIQVPTENIGLDENGENCDPLNIYDNRVTTSTATVIATPLRRPKTRFSLLGDGGRPLRSSSQSTNCLAASSMTSLNNVLFTSNQFLNNLIKMDQTKIWEDAKCRTFYARDNVSNFIRWSKEFGVNQSVLFESDDLVLHANPRQVVLCLLDVARIACVKHGFVEAPGLVKFEQEIDRELAAEKDALEQNNQRFMEGFDTNQSQYGDKHLPDTTMSANRKLSSMTKNSRSCSIGDATDDLIMRYCKHKEEEAARKKAAELEAATELELIEKNTAQAAMASVSGGATLASQQSNIEQLGTDVVQSDTDDLNLMIEAGSLKTDNMVINSPSGGDLTVHKSNLSNDNRDSLDSGEGRTESASTSHSRTLINLVKKSGVSAIPTPIKRSNSTSSLTSSLGTSELSSSRSSLLDKDDTNSNKRQIVSDLDGKVMRIAKSYYGKGATKGVTRLSEGKYKIADRIVFVRLLKGHRVMVRIGGGWDTLENFLFRHKSDPSQVIDVDNLLPIETKMTFEKGAQLTPSMNKSSSKLPYYRRSSSASSTNLSISNCSVSNHSTTNSSNASSTNTTNTTSNTPTRQNSFNPTTNQHPVNQLNNKQIPYFLIHRGQTKQTPQSAFYTNQTGGNQPSFHQKAISSQLKTPIKYNNRPLGSSRAPTASATNLYPATLTSRIAPPNTNKTMGNAKLNSSSNLHNGRTSKQEAFRRLGRSSDSLQANYYKSPQHRQHSQNGLMNSGNLSARIKIDTNRRSNNGLVR